MRNGVSGGRVMNDRRTVTISAKMSATTTNAALRIEWTADGLRTSGTGWSIWPSHEPAVGRLSG